MKNKSYIDVVDMFFDGKRFRALRMNEKQVITVDI